MHSFLSYPDQESSIKRAGIAMKKNILACTKFVSKVSFIQETLLMLYLQDNVHCYFSGYPLAPSNLKIQTQDSSVTYGYTSAF